LKSEVRDLISMRYRRSDPSITPVRRRPSLDFSVTGMIYLLLMLFMGVAAVNSQANLLFAVFGLMIGILLVSWIVSRAVLSRISVSRGLPDGAVVGTPTTITYELRNEKRWWPSLSVTVSELDGVQAFARQPQAYMLHAAPHMTAIVPAEVVPKRRGLHTFEHYQLSTSFPFGFIKRAADRRAHDSMLVYPALADVEPKLLQLMRSAESTGTTMRPRRGGMDEFYGLKEHRPGESPRFIYWRRSARTGTLVAKELTHVSPPKLVVLVDTHLPELTPAKVAAVERAIAMAGSIVSHACDRQLSVGLVAWTNDGWTTVQPNRGKRHRRELLTLLARLPRNATHDTGELVAAAAELQESATTLALFTPAGDDLFSADSTRSRNGLFVIPSESGQAQRWFRFHPSVDFAICAPTANKRMKDEG
jgi:uncharacterized protein (DUF58 family)